METKATLIDVSRDWTTGKMRLTFLLDGMLPMNILNTLSGTLRLKAVKWREKRSLRANSYYWELCSKTAAAMKISSTRLHNMMLRDYGKPHTVAGVIATMALPNTDEAEEEALEAEKFHVKPTTSVFENSNGVSFRWYIVLEGSHLMDSKEFSQLLNHMVDEAKGQGIETVPPDELAKMEKDLEEYENRRNKRN